MNIAISIFLDLIENGWWVQ